MSSENKNHIPSNEEVIEELTKDLKESAIKLDENQISQDETESLDEFSSSEANTEIRDFDFIDDELIKKRDETLNDDEKRVCIDYII